MITENNSIQERYEHLLKIISSDKFQKCLGLGNEIPFYICEFNVSELIEFDKIKNQLINRLEQNGIKILDINLYDLSIELLKEREIFEKIIEIESERTKDELIELLQGVLDTESYIIPRIRDKMNKSFFNTLFLSGVGEVFPYIRSHNILNNLQSVAKDKPTVMFFPGKYKESIEKGTSLELFGILEDDKYYRAFNIFHCEV